MAAPVPATTRGPQVDQEKGYFAEEIRDGLYWVTEGAYQAMFLTTGEGVIVCDAPPSIGEGITSAIKEVTDEPITHVIYSHSHSDHIGAANMFPAEAEIIAHEQTAENLKGHGDPRRPLPTETLSDAHELKIGNQVLALEYRGVSHEPGNIFVYAPQQKVLMFVDVIFPGWVPFKNMAMTEDPVGCVRSHDDILSYDFETIIGGHLTRIGTREDVEIQREYYRDVRAACERALRSVNWMEIANETGWENIWLIFDTYLDRIAHTAAAEVVPKWEGRLGAADVFTEDHCWVMLESMRIDEGYLPGPKGVVDEEVWWTVRR